MINPGGGITVLVGTGGPRQTVIGTGKIDGPLRVVPHAGPAIPGVTQQTVYTPSGGVTVLVGTGGPTQTVHHSTESHSHQQSTHSHHSHQKTTNGHHQNHDTSNESDNLSHNDKNKYDNRGDQPGYIINPSQILTPNQLSQIPGSYNRVDQRGNRVPVSVSSTQESLNTNTNQQGFNGNLVPGNSHQHGNAPSTNQKPSYSNAQDRIPNQAGTTYPNQAGTYPNQAGTYPNQAGTYPNQAGTYPNQGNSNHNGQRYDSGLPQGSQIPSYNQRGFHTGANDQNVQLQGPGGQVSGSTHTRYPQGPSQIPNYNGPIRENQIPNQNQVSYTDNRGSPQIGRVPPLNQDEYNSGNQFPGTIPSTNQQGIYYPGSQGPLYSGQLPSTNQLGFNGNSHQHGNAPSTNQKPSYSNAQDRIPNQAGTTYPNQAGTYPNQAGTYPNQAGTTYPNQAGTYPNQAGTYPNQAGTYPNQAGTYPNQGNSNHNGQRYDSGLPQGSQIPSYNQRGFHTGANDQNVQLQGPGGQVSGSTHTGNQNQVSYTDNRGSPQIGRVPPLNQDEYNSGNQFPGTIPSTNQQGIYYPGSQGPLYSGQLPSTNQQQGSNNNQDSLSTGNQVGQNLSPNQSGSNQGSNYYGATSQSGTTENKDQSSTDLLNTKDDKTLETTDDEDDDAFSQAESSIKGNYN